MDPVGFGSAGYISLSFPSVCRRLRCSPDPIRRHKAKGLDKAKGWPWTRLPACFASSDAFPLVTVALQSDLLGQGLGRPTPGASRRSLFFRGWNLWLTSCY